MGPTEKVLATILAAALLVLAAAPPARAENGRNRAFASGVGAGVVGTWVLRSVLAPRPLIAAPPPAARHSYHSAPPRVPVYRMYAPPPVVYYPAPGSYVIPPPVHAYPPGF